MQNQDISGNSEGNLARHVPSKRHVRWDSQAPVKVYVIDSIFQKHPVPVLQSLSDAEDRYRLMKWHEDLQSEAKREVTNYIRKLEKQLRVSGTGWDLLCREWPTRRSTMGGEPTRYVETQIRLEYLKPWLNFPSYNDILEFSKSSRLFVENFHTEIAHTNLKPWHEFRFNGTPSTIRPLSESDVAGRLQPFFSELNNLIRLATDGPRLNTKWVCIGSGKAARMRRKGGHVSRKEPDLTAFWTDGDTPISGPWGRAYSPENTPCLIVGDFKVSSKFNPAMIQMGRIRHHQRAQHALNQIHDYMDMHHNRFGYIITETELVMFCRREAGKTGQAWGRLDYSEPIPIQAPKGERNALMVLWYFHVKYAVLGRDKGWHLSTFYHNCPLELGGGIGPRNIDGAGLDLYEAIGEDDEFTSELEDNVDDVEEWQENVSESSWMKDLDYVGQTLVSRQGT